MARLWVNHNLATHIHHFIQDSFAFYLQASKPAQARKCQNWFNTALVESVKNSSTDIKGS